jgi:hypothetical protein
MHSHSHSNAGSPSPYRDASASLSIDHLGASSGTNAITSINTTNTVPAVTGTSAGISTGISSELSSELRESLFPVPKAPKIGRHKEPRPFHKAAPGYDMKTLRKQLDKMYIELEDRYEIQRALYSQNEQLWGYANSLLELNAVYKTQTDEQLSKMHNRFQLLQDEREGVCVALVEAQAVHSSLTDQQAAAADLRQALDMHEKRRADLTAELGLVTEESAELETHLQQQAGEVMKFHRELQEVTATKTLDDLDERADTHFFVTSKTILRGAFRRFEVNINRSRSVNSAVSVLGRCYSVHLLRLTYRAWHTLLSRKHAAAALLHRRTQHAAHSCFARWRTFAALERHFRCQARRRTLGLAGRILHEWSDICREKKWSIWAGEETEAYRCRLLLRHVLSAWRGVTTFLPWSGDWLRVPLQLAHRHYKRQLLLLWRRNARAAREGFADRILAVRLLSQRRALRLWKAAKLAVPAFARHARRRFIREVGGLCAEREAAAANEARARQHRRDSQQRQALWRMYHNARARAKHSRIQLALRDSQRVREKKHWRNVVRSVVYVWVTRSTFLRRSMLAAQLARDFRRRYMVVRALQKLKRLAGHSAKGHSLRSALRRRTHWAFLLWRQRVVPKREEIRSDNEVSVSSSARLSVLHVQHTMELASAHYTAMLRCAVLPAYFSYLRSRAHRFRCQRKAHTQVAQRSLARRRARAFLGWRCLWSKRLCWKVKAAVIDQSELFAQISLQQGETRDLTQEQEQVGRGIAEVTGAIQRMRKAAADKQDSAEHAAIAEQDDEQATQALRQGMGDLQAGLARSRADRERAHFMEEVGMCCAMLCYAMLSYAMLCCAVLCCAMLCCAMLSCAVLCYAMLSMLCYAVLCCAVLCCLLAGY